jgi:hypothetical protein
MHLANSAFSAGTQFILFLAYCTCLCVLLYSADCFARQRVMQHHSLSQPYIYHKKICTMIQQTKAQLQHQLPWRLFMSLSHLEDMQFEGCSTATHIILQTHNPSTLKKVRALVFLLQITHELTLRELHALIYHSFLSCVRHLRPIAGCILSQISISVQLRSDETCTY